MADTDLRTALASPLTRRQVLRAAAAAGVTAFLAACGGGASGSPAGSTGTGAASQLPSGSAPGESASADATEKVAEGPLRFANWPAYIDLNDEETESPTLVDFTETTGVEVDYQEEIQSNEDFFAAIEPQLSAGLPTDWDLIVVTDYLAARLVKAGWIEKIDPANVPNAVANVRDELKGYEWDPEMEYHYPWQSGATGIGYNSESTGREITSIADLFAEEFSGKVTLLTGYQDTFSLVGLLLKERGEIENFPPDFTLEDAQKIKDFIQPYVDSGHIRGFTGNEYLQDFATGDTWVAIVYSGDLASSGGENDVFVYPDEGSVIWTDNMLIPKGAEHKYAAELMIDFVYDVENAARLANWIYYISPVKGAQEAIRELDPEAADNPLLFPPEEVTAKQYGFPNVEGEEADQFQQLADELEGV